METQWCILTLGWKNSLRIVQDIVKSLNESEYCVEIEVTI